MLKHRLVISAVVTSTSHIWNVGTPEFIYEFMKHMNSDRHISFIDSNKGRFSALGIGCEVGRGVSGYTQSVSETLGLGPTYTS